MTQHQTPPHAQTQGPTKGNQVIEWIKSHKIISAIIAVVLIAALANLAGDGGTDEASPSPTPTPSTQSPTPTETVASDVAVPDVVGKPGDEAKTLLDDAGLDVDFESADGKSVFSPKNWTVVSQEPVAGAQAEVGETVTLNVERPESEEPEPTQTTVPASDDPIDSTVAAQFCAEQIEQAMYAAGADEAEVHWIAGVIANEMKDDGTRFVKVEATADKVKYNVECYIGGEGDNLELVDYAIY